MSSALFSAVCSIAPTRRRRFLWAAWWTAAPTRKPFRKPDASAGGARSRKEALEAAERAAGRPLQEIDGSWARAWSNLLVGSEPWPTQRAAEDPPLIRARSTPNQDSIWHTLGLAPSATVAEIKAAYKQRALVVHPDQGGSNESFRALHAAYEAALKRRARPARHVKAR